MKKEWKVYPWNMDDIFRALLSIFVFASIEGWNDIVYTYIDSNDSEYGPIYENKMVLLVYNIFIIYICAFFLVDLFVGVVFLNYVISE